MGTKYEVVVTGILDRYVADGIANHLTTSMPDSMKVEVREVEEVEDDLTGGQE